VIFKNNLRVQNSFLLFSSYIFYIFADWKFLAFLIAVSILNYILGIQIQKNNKYKKLFLWLGIGQGVFGLVYFKYFNFFIESFNSLFQAIHLNFNLQTLSILLPVGISFFTFRVISYLLDIDKEKIKASKDLIVFLNYVAFFPSILSGPIDKARDLIPQIKKQRVFDYNLAVNGMLQILWGLFKKVVIADNCATYANQIFNNYVDFNGVALLFGAFLFIIQLYADFSGYSDMAIGIGKLIGFKIAQNFNYPLFAQNIADFWQRWHMSLTTWLTEYIFTPLSIAFRNYGQWGLILAIVINFTVIGIWHGANWTFVIFGFLNGCLYIPLILKGKMSKKKKFANDKILPTFREFYNMGSTFLIVVLLMIIFKAKSIDETIMYFQKLILGFAEKDGYVQIINLVYWDIGYALPALIFVFILIEWFGKKGECAIETLMFKQNTIVKWSFYSFIVISIILFNNASQSQFLYVQF